MYFDKPENQERISDTGALGEPSSFLERTKAALDAATDRNVLNASGKLLGDAYDARIKAIRDATGEDLSPFNPMSAADASTMGGFDPPGSGSTPKTPQQKAYEFQQELERLATKKPEFRDIIAPHKPVHGEVASSVQGREQRSVDAGRNYGGPTGTGVIADFAGGMAAQALDPVNAASILIGPWGRAGQGAKAILSMGLKQGAANAAVEASMQPLVQDFRRQMGLSYGIREAAFDVGTAAAFGFGADVGIRSAARGIQSGLGRKAILDTDGGVRGYETAERAQARAEIAAKRQEQAAKIQALQDDGTLAKADAGDIEAIAKIDDALGLSRDDPAFRGARQVQEFVELEPGDFDSIMKERTFNQVLRAAVDADEPAPVIKSEIKSNRPSLSDEMELPTGVDGNQHYRTLDIEGKPVRYQNIDPKSITTDAGEMQFKSGGNSQGVTGTLGLNTTFDPAAAGRVLVFERGDGVMVIVDGHQRLSIAKDGDQMQGFVFREADGWSAAEVRAEAALKNIQEGRATLPDTVRALREHGGQMEGRIEVDTDFMRQAVALSRLSDEAYARVEAGTLEPEMAALIGELVPDTTKHDSVAQALMRANPASEAAARKIIGRETREPVNSDDLAEMMGASIAEPHVIEARTEVLAGVLTTLRGEPGYIGDIETQAVAAVIRRLANRQGIVADTLNSAGRAVAEGQPMERVVDATLRRFETVIAETGVKGLAGGNVVLSPVRLFALSDVSTGRSMRADLDALGYYSKALEVAKGLKQAKGTPEQMLAQLKSAGVKDAEIEATGLPAFLDGKKSITRDEIVKHLTDNRVGIQQKQYAGEAGYNSNQSIGRELMNRAALYQEPDRSEMIATARRMMDDTEDRLEPSDFSDYGSVNDEIQEIIESTPKRGSGVDGPAKWQSLTLDPSNPTYRETVLHLPGEREADLAKVQSGALPLEEYSKKWQSPNPKNDFQSGHFSEPNIIGHMMTSMNRHQGKPVYTLDQIQSDWGQELRDWGVRDEGKIAELKRQLASLESEVPAGVRGLDPNRPSLDVERQINALKSRVASGVERPDAAKMQRLQQALEFAKSDRAAKIADYQRVSAEVRTAESATPGNPLVNTTDQWTTTTLRRALRQAAEADAEFIAIPHGDTVLSYNPGDTNGMRQFYGKPRATEERLAELRENLVEQEAEVIAATGIRQENAQRKAEAIKAEIADAEKPIEGIVPKNLRKLLEKLDKDAKPSKVETLEATDGPRGWNPDTEYKFDKSQTGFTLFPLTEKVKRSVLEEGQPLFSRQTDTPAPSPLTLKAFTDNLEAVLKEAQQPPPPRLVDDVSGKDGKAHLEELRETMADDIKAVVDPVTVEARTLVSTPTLDPSKPLLYTPEANARMAEIRKEIDRTIQMLPPDVRLRVEDELVFNLNGGEDARIAGLWDGYDRIVYVALSAADPVRAVRHEVVHALKQSGLLTKDEFNQLYAFAEKLKLRQAYEIDTRYRDLYTKAYSERGGDYVEMLLREETIAEMFADYSLNGRRFGDVAGGGLVDQMIAKLVMFLKELRDSLHAFGFKNVNDIFQSIEIGEVASRPSARNPTGGRNPDVVARQIGEAMGGERLASDPLDLSPEARKARAEQMGFDTGKVWYHGAKSEFDAFDDDESAFGMGHWFADTRNYAEWMSGKNGSVVEAHVRVKNPYVFDIMQEAQKIIEDADLDVDPPRTSRDAMQIIAGPSAWDQIAADIAFRAKSKGHDAVIFKNFEDRPPGLAAGNKEAVLIFDPSNIRSVNAEFDPAKTGSANLLASMEGQRPSDMLNTALAALPEDTANAIRTVLKQANIDEAQLGPMLDQLMPLIRSGDQAAVAERVQTMAKEADPVMMPPQTAFGRDLASVQADREMTDVLGVCRL